MVWFIILYVVASKIIGIARKRNAGGKREEEGDNTPGDAPR
jgi:hypothetical protein